MNYKYEMKCLDMLDSRPSLVYYENLYYEYLHIIYFFIYVDDGQLKANEDAPENNPQYTTVYVGNLAPDVSTGWDRGSITSALVGRNLFAII